MPHILTRPERLRRIRSMHIAHLADAAPVEIGRRGGMVFSALRERECENILCARLYDPLDARPRGGGQRYCCAECKRIAANMRAQLRFAAMEAKKKAGFRHEKKLPKVAITRGKNGRPSIEASLVELTERIVERFGEGWFTRAEAETVTGLTRTVWERYVGPLGLEHRMVRQSRGGGMLRHEYRMPGTAEGGEG